MDGESFSLDRTDVEKNKVTTRNMSKHWERFKIEEERSWNLNRWNFLLLEICKNWRAREAITDEKILQICLFQTIFIGRTFIIAILLPNVWRDVAQNLTIDGVDGEKVWKKRLKSNNAIYESLF